jgi:hypothetical protein
MAPVDTPIAPPKDSQTNAPSAQTPVSRPTTPPPAPLPSHSTDFAAVASTRRPGWVTFAAVMTFIAAISYGPISLTEFANSTWFLTVSGTTYNLFSSHLFWWRMFDAAIAVLALIAAFSLLRGGLFGLIMGFCGAGFSILRWMFYIPAAPWLALMIIALDVLVIAGLCVSIDWFEDRNAYD